MWDTIIGRQIRRSSRNLLIWNVLVVLATVFGFVASSRYWYNFFLGPFPITATELIKLRDDQGSKFFVTTRGDFYLPIVLTSTERRKNGSEREVAKFLTLIMDGKTLVVKVAPGDNLNELNLRGVLRMLPQAEGERLRGILRSQLAAAAAQEPRLQGVDFPLLPVMLDTTTTRTKGIVALIVVGMIGFINVVNIFKAVNRLGNPQTHPTAQALLKYGEPEDVALRIDEEYESDGRIDIGAISITRSWLIHPTTFSVQTIFLGDAAWVYKSITQHYTNGVPSGKTYSVNLCDIHGQHYTANLPNEGACDDFVIAVLERVPWVLVGYDPQLDELWKKNKAQVYEIVESRRQELAEMIRRQRELADDDAASVADGDHS